MQREGGGGQKEHFPPNLGEGKEGKEEENGQKGKGVKGRREFLAKEGGGGGKTNKYPPSPPLPVFSQYFHTSYLFFQSKKNF